MSADTWPPALKAWVAKSLGQMTDSNRAEAQTEMRKVISDAFNAKALWTTDWAGVQLQSLLPKPPPVFNNLKRKIDTPSPLSKKAKKAAAAAAKFTPLSNSNDQAALNRRAQRFSREHEIERQKNMGGFGTSASFPSLHSGRSLYSAASREDDPDADPNVPNWDRHTIVGTSTELFKDFLRLTSEPNPETIRPYAVLEKTYAAIKQKWKERVSYTWICSQLKSVRQDLTVQRIKNEFTVLVYELHARLALECNDMVEYNACQAMLKSLYELGIPGKVEEFTAYRILLLLHGLNKSELNLYVAQLTSSQKLSGPVQHALAVQRTIAMGNYHAFYQLFLNAPNMGVYIMDHFVDRERTKALMVMARSYQKLPLSFISRELFEPCPEDDSPGTVAAAKAKGMADAMKFLKDHGAAIFDNNNARDADKILDCKACNAPLAKAYEEKNYAKAQIKGRV